jgi:hypothetical protein
MKSPTDEEVKKLAAAMKISEKAAREIAAAAEISGKVRPDGKIVTI